MYVIALASQKGGSGKTTLAGHLAIAAERTMSGAVALVDSDPQGSLSDWWNARQANTPLFARCRMAQLATDLERMRAAGVALVLVDTPPAILETVVEVIRHADLVLVPVQPSPHDLRAAAATVEFVERLAKPFIFVLNGATPRARITAEAALALSQRGALAPVVVHHRTGFAASMIDGRTVMEIADNGGAEEITELWDYINLRFRREFRLVLPDRCADDRHAMRPVTSV
ncbi:MAG TPA: ParA family protein [Stellaceae bacterium]|nr:ParA family protein [Stellaceae bacterium]